MQPSTDRSASLGEAGQTVVEYAMIVGVVSLALILLLLPIGQHVIGAMVEQFSNFELAAS